MLPLSAIILTVLSFGSGIEVVGSGSCPTPEAVAGHVVQILPTELWTRISDQVELVETEQEIQVVLHSADAGEVKRSIARQGSCDDLALAVAISIAAAETDLHGDESDSVELAKPRVVAPPPPPPPVAPVVVPPKPKPMFDFALGALATFADKSIAPGGALTVEALAPRALVGGRFAFTGSGLRSIHLGGGRFDWTRLAFSFGPVYRVFLRSRAKPFLPFIDLHLEPLIALVLVQGAGFAINRSEIGVDAGVGGGIRLVTPFRWIAPFLDLSFDGWLRKQEAISVDGSTATLPQFEVILSLGVTVGRFRSNP